MLVTLMPSAPPVILVNTIRRFPFLYGRFRTIWRVLRAVWWNALRFVTPPTSRIGPSKGAFSALELLQSSKLEGRFVEPAQPNPETGPKPLRSLMAKRMPIPQGEVGSWPIFWTRHRNARLICESLVIQDHRKRICYEGAYTSFCL